MVYYLAENVKRACLAFLFLASLSGCALRPKDDQQAAREAIDGLVAVFADSAFYTSKGLREKRCSTGESALKRDR